MRYGRDLHLRIVAPLLFALLLTLTVQARKRPPAKPLDLNAATAEQLEQLPGIGPSTAKAIVEFRAKSGPFRKVEDLLAVRGITRKRLEKIRRYITVAPPAARQRNRLLGTSKSGFLKPGTDGTGVLLYSS